MNQFQHNETDQPASTADEAEIVDGFAASLIDDDFQPRHWLSRIPLIAAGVVLAGLLITARTLTPAGQGMGTHQQLGLPECGFVTMFGIPCPSCGMTTSWSHLTRGQLLAAIRANPGGTLLGVSAAILAPWLILSGFLGRWFFRINLKIALVAVSAIFLTTVVNWVVRVFVV